ncbi:MAG: sigma-70 family RNA polymerase sigma factor [Planctomycetota bacterium]
MTDPTGSDLLLRHTRSMRRVALALLHDEHAADDAVQAAWVAALESPPRVLSFAWLRRAVTSRAQDELRRRSVRQAATTTGDEPDRGEAVGSAQERLELSARISNALARMREPYRTALYLRWFEDLAPTEIAKRLGEPVATVKTRLQRGLALLREDLERGTSRRELDAGLFALAGGMNVGTAAAPNAPLAPLAPHLGAALAVKKIAAAVVVLALAFALWFVRESPSADRSTAEGGRIGAELATDEQPRLAESEVASLARSVATPVDPAIGPPTVAGSSTTGAVRFAVTWSDGSRAEGVEVGVGPIVRGRSYGAPVESGVTGTDGTVVVRGLAPGTWHAQADRGARTTFEIEAGTTVDAELALARGLDVSGVVRDAAGLPIAGASIRMTTPRTDWLDGRVAATTDANGRYELRSAPPRESIAAFAEGFARSELLDLEMVEPRDGEVVADFTLAAGGAVLHGRVLGPDDVPLAGAIVAVGEPDVFVEERRNGTIVESWGPSVARTDEEGRFRLVDLVPGNASVAVRADGFGVLREELDVVRGPVRRDFRFQRPVVVRGTALDADGSPFPGVLVHAFDVAIPEDFLGTGQIDHYAVFEHVEGTAGADGRFELDALQPGELHLYAFEPHDFSVMRSVMRAQDVVAASPGELVVWDPVVSKGLAITGRTLFVDDSPMGDVFVTLRDEVDGVDTALVTDAEGRFEFLNLEPHTYAVTVQLWDAPEGTVAPSRTGVAPGGEDVVLQVAYAPEIEAAACTVIGRVDDVNRRVGGPQRLGATLTTGTSWYTDRECGESDFSFERVDPGRYRVVLWDADTPIGSTDWFEVAPGETYDVGTIVTEPAGELVIRVLRDDDARDVPVTIALSAGSGLWMDGVEVAPDRDTLVVPNLSAGTWSGSVWARGVVDGEFTADVEALGSTEVAVRVVRGAHCTVRSTWGDEAAPSRIDVVVRDGEGVEVASRSSDGASLLVVPVLATFRLAPGDYTVEATTPEGLHASAELRVVDLSERTTDLRLERTR